MIQVSETTGAGAEPEARAVHPVDVHVGHRLRARRKQFAITQEKLAAALNITFQQVQKYERGKNRISASMLYVAARFLKTTPGWFFEGLAFDDGTDLVAQVDAARLEPVVALAGLKGGYELARDFGSLAEDERRVVSKLARGLAAIAEQPRAGLQ
jgi:transcriptional regulator with XRE-family HTH domain